MREGEGFRDKKRALSVSVSRGRVPRICTPGQRVLKPECVGAGGKERERESGTHKGHRPRARTRLRMLRFLSLFSLFTRTSTLASAIPLRPTSLPSTSSLMPNVLFYFLKGMRGERGRGVRKGVERGCRGAGRLGRAWSGPSHRLAGRGSASLRGDPALCWRAPELRGAEGEGSGPPPRVRAREPRPNLHSLTRGQTSALSHRTLCLSTHLQHH